MLGRHTALRRAFVTLLTLSSAIQSLAALPEPQDARSSSRARVLQTTPSRTAQVQVCVREVPDLSRSNAGSVGAVLARFDLALGSIQPQKSAAPKGTIVGQSIKPGTQARCGTRIDVYVSDGMPNTSYTSDGPPNGPVPSLTDHSYIEVRDRLRGWTIGRVEKVETGAAQEGTVLKQFPAPRTMVRCGSSIDLAIAVAPPVVA